MTLTYDLYWSFRSPYSYFVTGRLVALERELDVACNVRVVYPLAVRQPEFFDRNDPLWQSYFMRDVFRTAESLGVPFGWARPDPVQRDMQTGRYPPEQPYIHRLTRLGAAAVEAGEGLAFLDEVSRTIWGGTTPDWHLGDHLAGAAARAGLDLAALDAMAAAEPERLDAIMAANQAAQREAGHYGVPLMAFNGEPFFGQDRFDQLKWRLLQAGAATRGR
ncbi:MAG: disulfide bond formation protein DsbA [Phenylobacterium sp.]|nr:disulfide bond formation protein DsbA [Phenylobacterium sp.]